MTKFKDIIFEKNVAIHCPEEWMSDVLLEYADSKTNIFWKRFSYLGCWREYKKNTVYYICNGAYGSIDHARKYSNKILHYNDVVIKEEEKMETKLDYELWIKGRKAKIGSKFFFKGEVEAIIESIEIDSEGWAIIFIANNSLEGIIENEVEEMFFWEKQTIYQLPDTEGNLSEVKIGQHVWVKHNKSDSILEYLISEFDGGNIKIRLNNSHCSTYISNKEGLTRSGGRVTTNKPSRFHGKQDWSQAPEKAVAWSVENYGYSYWFEEKPKPGDYVWISPNACHKTAGYRNDLINDREYKEVTDWKESLVMRPKDV